MKVVLAKGMSARNLFLQFFWWDGRLILKKLTPWVLIVIVAVQNDVHWEHGKPCIDKFQTTSKYQEGLFKFKQTIYKEEEALIFLNKMNYLCV